MSVFAPTGRVLGYAQRTTNFTITGTTADTQVTSLTITITVPAGGYLILQGSSGALYNSVAATNAKMTIWDGTVGSGTQVSYTYGMQGGSSATGANAFAVLTGISGSKTYNIGLATGSAGSTSTLEAAATGPSFIMASWMSS